MPSGMLWMVTARSIRVVFRRWDEGPSGALAKRCRWGVAWSRKSRNRMPSQKPTRAGRNERRPRAAPSSMAGMISDQMDAATMTPAAKPVMKRFT